MEPRKLYRSANNKMIAGVASGVGEYLNIDPTLVRLGFIVLALMGGPGLLAYIIMWVVVPLEPSDLPPMQ